MGTSQPNTVGIGDTLSYLGLCLFTLLLYARPNELFPAIFGAFPIARIVVIMTSMIYIASTLNQSRPLTIWSPEMGMVISIALLAVLFLPGAVSPQDTVDTLSDTFLKVVLIFALMINLLNNWKRLRSLLDRVDLPIRTRSGRDSEFFLRAASTIWAGSRVPSAVCLVIRTIWPPR